MILVLLEAENNLINPVLQTLTSKVNPSCVKYLNKKVKPEQLADYKKPPLLESGWFLVYDGGDRKVIQFLAKLDFNVTVLQAFTRSKGELICGLLTEGGFQYKIVDNLNVSKKAKLDYIKRELNLSEADTTYLYNRTRGYLKDLTNGVFALKGLPQITRKDIKALVPKTEKFGLNDLYNYLIGASSTSMKYEDAIKIVYKYRYGFEFLRDFLLEKLKLNICVYEKVSAGELSIENYRENTDKSLTSLTKFQLYKLIEQYREVSYDYLYFLLVNLSSIPTNSLGILMLINLFKIRKETTNV